MRFGLPEGPSAVLARGVSGEPEDAGAEGRRDARAIDCDPTAFVVGVVFGSVDCNGGDVVAHPIRTGLRVLTLFLPLGLGLTGARAAAARIRPERFGVTATSA